MAATPARTTPGRTATLASTSAARRRATEPMTNAGTAECDRKNQPQSGTARETGAQLALVPPAHDDRAITVAQQRGLAEIMDGVPVQPEPGGERPAWQGGACHLDPRHSARARHPGVEPVQRPGPMLPEPSTLASALVPCVPDCAWRCDRDAVEASRRLTVCPLIRPSPNQTPPALVQVSPRGSATKSPAHGRSDRANRQAFLDQFERAVDGRQAGRGDYPDHFSLRLRAGDRQRFRDFAWRQRVTNGEAFSRLLDAAELLER